MKEEIFYTKKDVKDTKIAIIADIHYCPNYNEDILKNIYKQLLKAKPQYLVVAGDILDRSNYKHEGLIEFFKKISKEMTIIVILGNHDNYIETKEKKVIEGYIKEFIEELLKIDNTFLLRYEKKR